MTTRQRAQEPFPSGRLSVSHYKALHHHLFQDVYSWAGRFRTIRLSKATSSFCYPENISASMQSLFGRLQQQSPTLRSREQFVAYAAHFLSELNAIHPFREGNGRTQLNILIIMAARYDHRVELTDLQPDRFLTAMISAFNGDERLLTAEVNGAVA